MAGDPWRREERQVPDGRRPMAGAGGPQRLRDWLVAQIESGRYAGLRWEDAGKTLFRIPWKHAAQQGYQAQQDAALFRGMKGLERSSWSSTPSLIAPHPPPTSSGSPPPLLTSLVAKSKDAITVIFDAWAWAIHKGRHLEGIDKEDPPTWKTRLRCALNKSADFCEVRERSQLDISDPYKVYRIVSGSAHGPVARTCAPPGKKNILRSRQEPPGDVTELVAHGTDQASSAASSPSLSLLPARPLLTSAPPLLPPSAPPAPSLRLQRLRTDGSRSTTEDKDKEGPPRLAQQGSLPPAVPGPLADHRYQVQDPTHRWSPSPSEDFSNPGIKLFAGKKLLDYQRLGLERPQCPGTLPQVYHVDGRVVFIYTGSCCHLTGASPTTATTRIIIIIYPEGAPKLPQDCWLHVRLFYGAELVREATSRTAEGCRLSPEAVNAAERLLGPPPRVAQVGFPEPPPGARVLQRLLRHLERGVLLWVAPEGVFAKRLCRGRVYWRGPLAPHRAQPNKLERERTCQLLDTRRFLEELRAHLQDGHQEPEYQIRLCFGEEYPGPPDQPEERLIMAHVEPVFARELFLHWKRHYHGATAKAGPQPRISDGITHLLPQLSQH
ncbi:interferon regulatory factor 4 isoform X1 [Prionailurus iriomotensis]